MKPLVYEMMVLVVMFGLAVLCAAIISSWVD